MKRLVSIITDIVDFSKIKLGWCELKKMSFSLRGLIENVTAFFATQTQTNKTELVCRVSSDIPNYVVGDSMQLRHALINLLRHVCTLTEQGQVVLHVKLAAVEGDDIYIQFDIRNRGIRMRPECAANFSTSFKEIDVAATRRFGVTGLGLAVSRELVELMGGAIEGDSIPGEGLILRFTVRFGYIRSQEKRQDALRVSSTLGAKVLLAEDNAVSQLVATRMLRKLGLAVEVAHNGQEALQKQRSGRYDLVLMDCEMPVLDGYGATGKWRSYEATVGLVRTPIVAMTANAMPGDREACLAAGMDDYIAKPVRLEVLKTTLSHWLAESKSLPLGERVAKGKLCAGVVQTH